MKTIFNVFPIPSSLWLCFLCLPETVSYLIMKSCFLKEDFSNPPNQGIVFPDFPVLWGIYDQYLFEWLIYILVSFSERKVHELLLFSVHSSSICQCLLIWKRVHGCASHPLRGEEEAGQLTALMSESRTLTANAVPHAKGCVRYSSVSGSSSSSWSKNWTLVSFTRKGIKEELALNTTSPSVMPVRH